MFTIWIDNVNYTNRLMAGSLSVNLGLQQQRSCSASFFSSINNFKSTDVFADGKDVKVRFYGDVIFGGIIKSYTMSAITPIGNNDAEIQTTIQSDGYDSIPARRHVSVYYASSTAHGIVSDMITAHLSADGITAGTISNGPAVTQYTADYKSIKEILDDMASVSGYVWMIDSEKKLSFIQQETVTNSLYNLEENGGFQDFHDVSVQSNTTKYANKVFVLGGQGSGGTPVRVIRENIAEIAARQASEGGSGIYGTILQDSNIKSVTVANQVGDVFLKKSAIRNYTLSFSSYTYGFLPGQKLRVTLPSLFGYETSGALPNHYYLIEDVVIDREDAAITKYTVTATRRNENDFSSQKSEGFKEYFETLIKK